MADPWPPGAVADRTALTRAIDDWRTSRRDDDEILAANLQ